MFTLYPLHLNQLLATLRNTDGGQHLLISHGLDVDKIQTQFDANAISVKKRQMISNLNWDREIHAQYQEITNDFCGLLKPFGNSDAVNASFDEETSFVHLHDIQDNGNDPLQRNLKGKYTSLLEEVQMQLMTETLRDQMDFLEIRDVETDEVVIPKALT